MILKKAHFVAFVQIYDSLSYVPKSVVVYLAVKSLVTWKKE